MRYKNLLVIALVFAMTITVVMGNGDPNASPGAIFAVDSNGNDKNLYPGTEIYIYGHHLVEYTAFSWEIYDMAVSGGQLVNSGIGGMTNGEGKIFPYQDSGWKISDGDYAGHKYKLKVLIGPTEDDHYAEFYIKVDSFAPVPEQNTMTLTSVGLLALVLISKIYRRQ